MTGAAVVTASPDDGLDGLRAAFPGYTFWRGRHTGEYWAMPPRGGELISADSPAGLAERIEQATRAEEILR